MQITKSDIDDQGYIKVSISTQNTVKTAEILNNGWGLYQTNENEWSIPYHMFYPFKAAAELSQQFV